MAPLTRATNRFGQSVPTARIRSTNRYDEYGSPIPNPYVLPPQPPRPTGPSVSFFVAGTPTSTNARRRTRRDTGVRYTTRETRAWETAVAETALFARQQIRALGLPLQVTLLFQGTRADLDNLLKSTVDGLMMGLDVDDYWMNPLITARVPGKPAGVRVVLEASPYRRPGVGPKPARKQMPAPKPPRIPRTTTRRRVAHA